MKKLRHTKLIVLLVVAAVSLGYCSTSADNTKAEKKSSTTSKLPIKLTCTRLSKRPLLSTATAKWPKEHNKGRKKRAGASNVMFPSVLRPPAGSSKLGDRFHMYFASHCGQTIGLATSKKLEGPWEVYTKKPVLSLSDCRLVSHHLSSPHVVVCPDGSFLMYYHGRSPKGQESEGQHTGVAKSTDGVNFQEVSEPGPLVAVPKEKCSIRQDGSLRRSGSSYFRVIIHQGKYHAFLRAGTGIEHAVSTDGIHWKRNKNKPLIQSALEDDNRVDGRIRHCGVCMLPSGHVLLFYSVVNKRKRRETIEAVLLEPDGDTFKVARRYGTLMKPKLNWENKSLRDPHPIFVDDKLYLFYVAGGEKTIGLARVEMEK